MSSVPSSEAEADLDAEATKAVLRHPQPLLAVRAFRAQTGAGLREAITLVGAAFNRTYGRYYVVNPGSDQFEGPFVGLEAAGEASSRTGGTAVLVVPAWSGSIIEVAMELLRVLPRSDDEEIVGRLLRICLDAMPDYNAGGRAGVTVFIEAAWRRLEEAGSARS